MITEMVLNLNCLEFYHPHISQTWYIILDTKYKSMIELLILINKRSLAMIDCVRYGLPRANAEGWVYRASRPIRGVLPQRPRL